MRGREIAKIKYLEKKVKELREELKNEQGYSERLEEMMGEITF